MVTIGSARIDERGKIYGGAAGDQTGNEVGTQKWYRHGKGWYTLRCTVPGMGKAMAEVMLATCGNPKVGYDQWNRRSYTKALEAAGWRPENVTEACETDCSELIRACILAAAARLGVKVEVPEFSTGNERRVLLATGIFSELVGSEYNDDDALLGPGDVQVTRSKGHTIMVLTAGERYDGGATLVRELGERILKRGMLGEDVRTMQEYLNKLGYNVGPDGPDGDFGRNTESALQAFQNAHGLDDDGEYGPLTHEAMLTAIEALADVPVIGAPDGTGLLVKDGSWNIRTGPGTAYDIAGVAHGGDRLGEIQTDGWKTIRYNGEVRYISEKAIAG